MCTYQSNLHFILMFMKTVTSVDLYLVHNIASPSD